MNTEEVPDVEEIKARLKEEIPVEDDSENLKHGGDSDSANVDDALRNLGQQFARTFQTAWNSEQRLQVQKEIQQGVQHFAQEMEKVFQEAKESPAGQKARQEAAEAKANLEQGEFGQKARTSAVQGLHWLSEELGKLADQFSPTSKDSGGDPPTPSE